MNRERQAKTYHILRAIIIPTFFHTGPALNKIRGFPFVLISFCALDIIPEESRISAIGTSVCAFIG